MTPLFKRLNLGAHTVVHVLDAPASFEAELAQLGGTDGFTIHRKLATPDGVTFALAFVTRRVVLDTVSAQLCQAAKGDAVLWMVYPKGSSKNYSCDFNRDTGWDVLHAAGFDSVRMVAIDADWSALRFRRVEFIQRP